MPINETEVDRIIALLEPDPEALRLVVELAELLAARRIAKEEATFTRTDDTA